MKQGLKKVQYGSQWQVDFIAGQVTFKAYLLDGQGSRQVIPLTSPNIQVQILHTSVHTLPYRISWENLINDQSISPLFIIL